MKKSELSIKERICFGFGAAGLIYPNFYLSVYLMMFLTTIAKLSPLAVGTMFLISKLFDAINDSWWGMFADRVNTKWGHYRPWVFIGSIPSAVFLVLCFCVPLGWSSGAKLAWSYVFYILWTVSTTMSRVSFGSLPSVMSTNYNDRGVLGTFREVGSNVASLTATVIITAIITFCGGLTSGTTGYIYSGIILGILGILCMTITTVGVCERVQPVVQKKEKFLDNIGVFKGNLPAVCLILTYFFMGLCSVVRAGFNNYYATYFLQNEVMAGTIMTAKSIAPFCFFLFAPGLMRKIGKKNMLMLGNSMQVIAGLLFLLAGKENYILVYIASFFSGLGSMAIIGMWSAIPDVADYGEYRNGIHSPSLVFGVINFSFSFAMSVASYIIGFVLKVIGWSDALAVQTASTQSSIYWFNGGALILCGVLCLLCMIPYKLTAARSKEIADELESRYETTNSGEI